MVGETLGFLGGTGPQGRGLAARFALAGHPVLLGSREPERGRSQAAELAGQLGRPVEGAGNDEVARRADVVFVVVPYAAQRATVEPLAGALDGKLVLNCVNHMAFDDRGPYSPGVPGGSAAEECAALLPRAALVSAFHDVSARTLADLEHDLDCDILVCGDDEEAKARVVALAGRVPNLRGVDCGPLRMSRAIEDLTPVLVNINRRYDTHAGIRIAGL